MTSLGERAEAIAGQLRNASKAAALIADARDETRSETAEHAHQAETSAWPEHERQQEDGTSQSCKGGQPVDVPGCRPDRGDTIGRLDALGTALSALGWTAHVRTLPGRIPGLRATNPEPGAAELSEDIYAKPATGGEWEYWWPWGERIASDPSSAAAIIVRVLRPAGTP